MKNVTGVYTAPRPHWVGDGFPVRSMFSYQTHGESLSPFLLLDYAGPYTFPADGAKRGVGEHPHRGFETVTSSKRPAMTRNVPLLSGSVTTGISAFVMLW